MAVSFLSRPRVSVVVPLFNHERYIEAALESVLNQSTPADEIIVVDDGSTDTSAAKVRAFAAKHPEIIFWSQPNQGADYTLNAGIHRATGEFVSILNSDDLYSPTRLEECLEVFKQQPEVAALATGLTFIDADGAELASPWYEDARAFYERTQDLALALINANFFITTSNLVARRAVFDEIGYFAPLRYAHDLDLFLRLLARGRRVHFLDKSLLRYRSHGANTIRENEQRVRVERAAVIASFILNAWAEHSMETRAWRSYLDRIAEITDPQALTGLIDHFLGRYEFLALPRLGASHESFRNLPEPLSNMLTADFPLRGLRQPLANELTLAQQSERITQQAERIGQQEQTIATLQSGLEEKRLAFLRQEENIAALRGELEEKRAAFLQQEQNIGALRSTLEQERVAYQREISALRGEIEAKSAAIASLGATLAALNAELAAWKGTRSYLISELWSGGSSMTRKLARTSYLLAGWAVPEGVKRRLRPLIGRVTAGPLDHNGIHAGIAPYQVRTPAPHPGRRPRVTHAIANFFTGGSSRLVVDLIEHLGDRYQQEVITSRIPSPPAYVGLQISEFRNPNDAGEFAAYFRRFRPDLVHVHYWGDCDRPWYEAVFRAARESGCRIIENINTPVEPYFDKCISQYVYVSEYVLDHFGRRDAISRIIHPGSNFDIFSAQREQLPQPDCIGMVYRLENDKLNDKAIDVFIKVVKRRPITRALIVGGGAYLEPYRAAAASEGVSNAFTFTGYVPYEDLPQYYLRMTLFVAPVWQESFGQVSPFAMSMGIPVVGYDIGALSEIIGAREFLAPAGDSDRLADIIIGLLDDPARIRVVGEANQKRAQALFSLQSMIDRYAELYQQVLS